MDNKIQVTIDIIIHATEDISKIFDALNQLFEIEQEKILVQELKGHFDNPITTLHAKFSKKDAKKIVGKIVSNLTESQERELIDSLEQRIQNSTLHLRFDKQKLVQGNIDFREKDPVKIKIFTPIYTKKDAVKIFSELLKKTN